MHHLSSQEAMNAGRDDFREALLQAGRQEGFMRIKWYVFAVGAFYGYGSLLCREALSVEDQVSCALELER